MKNPVYVKIGARDDFLRCLLKTATLVPENPKEQMRATPSTPLRAKMCTEYERGRWDCKL
jgi:hypothetical protein